MAYSFTAASSQYLSTASSPISGQPCTLATWFQSSSSTAVQVLVYVGAPTATSRVSLQARGDVAGDPLRAAFAPVSAQVTVDTASGYSVNTWTAGAAVFASNTSRSVYIDGSGASSSTSASGSTSWSAINIATNTLNSTASSFLSGVAAEAAIWSVALTDAEIASLAKGFKPTRIRPQSLVFYAPLIRDLKDWRGGLTITNNNTATVADHPRVY